MNHQASNLEKNNRTDREPAQDIMHFKLLAWAWVSGSILSA